MADVTGPISTLPGTHHAVPEGMVCDEHPDRPAIRRIQGETDSFGSEMHDLCEECYKAHTDALSAPDSEDNMDYCQKPPGCGGRARLFAYRDWEEGSCGPIYHICGPCKAHLMEGDRKALSEMREDEDDFYDDPSDRDYDE